MLLLCCSTFTYLNHNRKKHKLISNRNEICRKELKKETPNEKKKNQTRRNQNETTISIYTIYMFKLLLFFGLSQLNSRMLQLHCLNDICVHIYISNLLNSNQCVHCTGFTLFFFTSSSSSSILHFSNLTD